LRRRVQQMMTFPALLAFDLRDELTWSIPAEIERFLSGASEGAALLGALYDDVLDEPVPDRLTALCRAN
jgi:hypothetical protein